MGHIGTPARFRDKRAIWKGSGLAVVTHSSADYTVDAKTGKIQARKRVRTRGLNHDYDRRLKEIFKSAAMTAIKNGVFKEHYDSRVAGKMREEMARLTIARKISAAFLACWQKGETFDLEKMKPSKD